MGIKLNFNRETVNRKSLSIVQFKTEWNGACQIISMIYDDLAMSYQDAADFYTVDYEQEPGLSKEYGVIEVPTILFFKDGQLVDHAIGLIPKNVLIAKIETALNSTIVK